MKAALLLVAAAAAFGVLGATARTGAEHLLASAIERLAASTEYESVRRLLGHALGALLAWLTGATPHRLVIVGAIALGYAVLLTIEGLGLLWDRPWAELVSVVITASLIPFEVREVLVRFTAGRVVILVLNVLAVLYLARRLLRRGAQRRAEHARLRALG